MAVFRATACAKRLTPRRSWCARQLEAVVQESDGIEGHTRASKFGEYETRQSQGNRVDQPGHSRECAFACSVDDVEEDAGGWRCTQHRTPRPTQEGFDTCPAHAPPRVWSSHRCVPTPAYYATVAGLSSWVKTAFEEDPTTTGSTPNTSVISPPLTETLNASAPRMLCTV